MASPFGSGIALRSQEMLEAPVQSELRGPPGAIPEEPPAPRNRLWLRYGAAGLAAVTILGFSASRLLDRPKQPDGLLQANGRIEGDQVTIASKIPGRVVHLAVREGATVRRDELLLVLDDAQAVARVDQMNAALAEANGGLAQSRTRVGQARAAVSTTEARLAAANTALDVLQHETVIHLKGSEAGLDSAHAVLARAQSAESQARRDAERYKFLSERGDVEARRSEQADLSLVSARSELTAAQSQLTQAGQQLKDAQLGPQRIRAKQDEIRILEAQLAIDHAGVEQAQAALVQAEAAVRRAEAGLREVASTKADLTIRAPTNGVVMTRTTEEGEVVAAGSPLLTLIDLDRLYLRVFVPEVQIGVLRLGLPARIFTDAFPGQPFPATVRYISSRAEFTPREVQTQEERVKLVYAAKLYLDANPDHRLTPGLPADAMIRWKDGVPWALPRW